MPLEQVWTCLRVRDSPYTHVKTFSYQQQRTDVPLRAVPSTPEISGEWNPAVYGRIEDIYQACDEQLEKVTGFIWL